MPLACPRAADIAFALDESTSITYDDNRHFDNWYVRILGFAASIVRAFTISPSLTQIGALKFSDHARVSFLLNSYSNRNDVIAAIRRMKITFGNTNIASALRLARTVIFDPRNGARPGLPKILILVTDGAATAERHLTTSEADQAKAAGINIFTVGIGNRIDAPQLRRIATTPSQFYNVSSFKTLSSVLQTLVDHSCSAAATLPPDRAATSPVSPICYNVTFPMPTTPSTTTTTKSQQYKNDR